MGQLLGHLTNSQTSPAQPPVQMNTPTDPTFTQSPGALKDPTFTPTPGPTVFPPQMSIPTGTGVNDPAAGAPIMSTPTGGLPAMGAQPGVSNTPSFMQASRQGPGGMTNALSPALTNKGKILTALLSAAAGGLASAGVQGPGGRGIGVGGGFATGVQLPFEQAQMRQEATRGQLENERTAAQTKYLPQILQANLGKTTSQTNKNIAQTGEADAQTAAIPTKAAAALRKQGLNAQGEPLSYDDLSPVEQAHYDLSQATTDQKEASADLAKFRSDPNSPQYKLAAQRLSIAQQNANTAIGKLGLGRDKYNADYLGQDAQGQPLPGIQFDDAGNPIGPRVANSNNPSADRIKRSDLARNVQTNTASIREIINRRPDLFGKLSGRITTVQQMIGSDDPDIAKLGVEIHNTALASNGAHGLRSQQAIQDTENAMVNHFKNGPQATLAGLDSLDQSVGTFIDDAKLGKKAGDSPNAPPRTPHGIPKGAKIRDYTQLGK